MPFVSDRLSGLATYLLSNKHFNYLMWWVFVAFLRAGGFGHCWDKGQLQMLMGYTSHLNAFDHFT